MQSLQVEKIKVGKGKKAKKVTVLVLQFSGALFAESADNAKAYDLAPVIAVKATGKGKHRKPATTKLGTPVTPASAVFTASNNQVTLTPRGTLNLTKPEELIVNGDACDRYARPRDRRQRRRPTGRRLYCNPERKPSHRRRTAPGANSGESQQANHDCRTHRAGDGARRPDAQRGTRAAAP